MNYLLDTHVLLWTLFESRKLSNIVKQIILNPDCNIFVSIFSFWEISLKYGLGKISLNNIKPDDLPDITQKSGIELLYANPLELSSSYKLPKTYHKDPFDRIIIWQCIQNDFILLSKDIQIQQYKDFGLKVTW